MAMGTQSDRLVDYGGRDFTLDIDSSPVYSFLQHHRSGLY